MQDARGGSCLFDAGLDNDYRILSNAATLENFATLAAIGARSRCILQDISAVWEESRLWIRECTCAHLCTAKVFASLCPSCPDGKVRRPSIEDPTHLMQFDVSAANGRLVYLWTSGTPVPPAVLVRTHAPEVLECDPATDLPYEITLGYTDTVQSAQAFATNQPANRWCVRLLARNSFPDNCWFDLKGRRVAVRAVSGLPRRQIAWPNTMCLLFSGARLQLFWNGFLPATCPVPEELLYPGQFRSMHCFCAIFSERGFRMLRPQSAVTLRLPVTGEGKGFPTASMRLFSTQSLSGPNFCLAQDMLVYLWPQSSSPSCAVHVACHKLAHAREVQICVGFTNATCASSVVALLQGASQLVSRHAWGFWLRADAGKVHRCGVVRSWNRHARSGCSEAQASHASNTDSIVVRYRQENSDLRTQTNSGHDGQTCNRPSQQDALALFCCSELWMKVQTYACSCAI